MVDYWKPGHVCMYSVLSPITLIKQSDVNTKFKILKNKSSHWVILHREIKPKHNATCQ